MTSTDRVSLESLISGRKCLPGELNNCHRLELLNASGLLDGGHERLDRLTSLAREILETAVVLVSLVEVDRQVFPSQNGLPDGLTETPISHSFCQHVVTSGKPLIIEDARKDSRVSANPAIQALNILAYAGYPIVSQGQVLGSFCTLLPVPHAWSERQLRVLREFAEAVSDLIDLRLEVNRLGQSREQLKKSNRELEQFADILSHDLKAPLRGVRGSLQLLELELAPLSEDAAEFLSHALSSAVRMTELIDALSTYSQAFVKTTTPRELSLDQLLDEVETDLQSEFSKLGGTLIRDGLLGKTCGHATVLRQLLQNLIANGLKFQPPGQAPIIHVGRDLNGAYYVRDNGIGLEAKYHETVFEIYRSAHSRDVYAGTGMGLAICARAVAEHHGTIWLESVPGEGCTFFFTLSTPASHEPAATS